MSAPLFEHRPEECPRGHQLAPGRIQVSWQPCLCSEAKAAAERGRGMGHLLLRCRACDDEGRDTTYREPPHVPS